MTRSEPTYTGLLRSLIIILLQLFGEYFLEKPVKVLDLGCGPGHVADSLKHIESVTGVDGAEVCSMQALRSASLVNAYAHHGYLPNVNKAAFVRCLQCLLSFGRPGGDLGKYQEIWSTNSSVFIMDLMRADTRTR